MKLRVVVDSSADFTDARLAQHLQIGVLPWRVRVGSQAYTEDVNLSAEQYYTLVGTDTRPPVLDLPDATALAEQYRALANGESTMLSLHLPEAISGMSVRASEAASLAANAASITIFAADTISAGLGWLAEAAAQLAPDYDHLSGLLTRLRVIDRHCFSMFYIHEVGDFLRFGGMMHPAEIAAARITDIHPMISLDEGDFHTVHSVNAMEAGISYLVDYVREFDDIERVCVVHSGTVDQATIRRMARRLRDHWRSQVIRGESTEAEIPKISTVLAKPSLAHFIGNHAIGIIAKVKC